MIAILHHIRSKHNVGSLFRSADAIGIKTLYLTGITPAPIDEWGRECPAIQKVSLGAERTIAWKKHRSATSLLDTLSKQGYVIVAIEQAKNSIPINRLRVKKTNLRKTALVVGNEVRGLSSAILRRADFIGEIPLFGKKESLNVAVSFGIAAYFLRLNAR